VSGNQVEELINGDEIFPPMLAAIRAAEKTITFEPIFTGPANRQGVCRGTRATRTRGRQGACTGRLGRSVKMDDQLLQLMKDAGVEILKYHRCHWYHLARMNNRTHRKLLVVDGKVGFTAASALPTTGWKRAGRRSLARLAFSYRRSGGGAHAGGIHGQLDENQRGSAARRRLFPAAQTGRRALRAGIQKLVVRGQRKCAFDVFAIDRLGTQNGLYRECLFVPDDLSVQTIVRALQRGVKVKILMPGTRTDSEPVRRASRARWGELLEAGAEMYEYQPTMFHCKVMIVDDVWVSVGSTNFDSRSFRLNDEANLNIYDHAFANARSTSLRTI